MPDINELFDLIKEELADGKIESAINHISKATEISPDDYRFYGLLGEARAKKKEYANAIEAFTRCLDLHPAERKVEFEITEPIYDLGKILIRNRRYDDATKCYRLLLRCSPSDFYFRSLSRKINYIKERGQGKRLEDVIHVLDLLEKCERYFRFAQYREANPEGWIEETRNMLSEAAKLGFDFDLIWEDKGIFYQLILNFEEAIINYKNALNLNPQGVTILNHLGTAYHEQGYFEDAIKQYSQALKIDSAYEEAKKNMQIAESMILSRTADEHKRKGELTEAIKHYEESLSLVPDNKKVERSLNEAIRMKIETDMEKGKRLLEEQKNDEALTCFKEILAAKPNYEPARKWIKIAKEALGRQELLSSQAEKRKEEFERSLHFLEAIEILRDETLDKERQVSELASIISSFDIVLAENLLTAIQSMIKENRKSQEIITELDKMLSKKLEELNFVNMQVIPSEIHTGGKPRSLFFDLKLKELTKTILKQPSSLQKLETINHNIWEHYAAPKAVKRKSPYKERGIKLVDRRENGAFGYEIWLSESGKIILGEVVNYSYTKDMDGEIDSAEWSLEMKEIDTHDPHVILHKHQIKHRMEELLGESVG
ncbi:MAG: tetratricopeptide repeat protein [Candidatus Hodarchaeota archaeon]